MNSRFSIVHLCLLGAVLTGCAKKPAKPAESEEPRTDLLKAALDSFLGVPRHSPVTPTTPGAANAQAAPGVGADNPRRGRDVAIAPPAIAYAATPGTPDGANATNPPVTPGVGNVPPNPSASNAPAPVIANVTVIASAPVTVVEADGHQVVVSPAPAAAQNPPNGSPDSNVTQTTIGPVAPTGSVVGNSESPIVASSAPGAAPDDGASDETGNPGAANPTVQTAAPSTDTAASLPAESAAPGAANPTTQAASAESAAAVGSTNTSGSSGAPTAAASAARGNTPPDLQFQQALWNQFAVRWGAGPGFTGVTAGANGSTGVGAGPGSTGVTAGSGSTGIGAGSGYTGETGGPGSTGIGATSTTPLESPANVHQDSATAGGRAILWFTPWGPMVTTVAVPATATQAAAQ